MKFFITFSETQHYSTEISAEDAEDAERKINGDECDKKFIRHGATNIYHISEVRP